MIELDFNGTRHPIRLGEMAVGSDPDSALQVSGEGVAANHAVVQGMPDGTAAIRRADPDATVEVNGIRLGENPTPLLHGDKVRLGEVELLVVDSGRAGSTQFMSSAELPEPSTGGAPERQESTTAGRIVCLTDGREYAVETALVFGREAGADVVVAGSDVSRRHAEIVYHEGRYLILDHSTNGTFVNGIRMGQERTLARSDIIRIGPEEFRFYAEPAPDAEAAAPGAEHKLFDTMHGIPVSALGAPSLASSTDVADGPVFGSLLVRDGDHKGERLEIAEPVVTIGRAAHNHIVFDDASVSASHARLELRGTIWLVSDLASTNGTFADGDHVLDEVPLAPGATIRLGEVSFLFDPLEMALPEPGLEPTRAMDAMEVPERDEGYRPADDVHEPIIGFEPTTQDHAAGEAAVAPEEALLVPLSGMDQFEPPAVVAGPVAEEPEPAVEELFAEQAADDPVISGKRPVFVSGGMPRRRGPPVGLLVILAAVALLVVLYVLGMLDPVMTLVTDLIGG